MEVRKKRLVYQATHRGLREADLLLGNGIQLLLRQAISEEEVLLLEELLQLPDPVLMDWMLKGKPLPQNLHQAPICQALFANAFKT